MAAASSVVELCTLAHAKLDAATASMFFHADDGGSGATSSSSSCWPEAERTPSRLTCQAALEALCDKHQVPADYVPIGLDSSWAACRPPPEGSNAMCVYAGAFEAGMRIPLHELYVAVLGHYGLAPSQLAPDAWLYMSAFVLLCEDAGVEPTLRVFRSFFSLCTHRGDAVGWHHFSCRPYFEPRSGGITTGLFAGKMPRWTGWQCRFFHLRAPPTTPWPCAVNWGKPRRAAVRLPEVTWEDTVLKRLLERTGGSAIDVMEFLSRRSPPVVAPPLDAPTPSPSQQQELRRKRKSFSDTHTHRHRRGLVDCVTEAAVLAKKAMAELDGKGMELQAATREVAHLKEQVRAVRDKHARLEEELRVANAHHAAEVRRLEDRASTTQRVSAIYMLQQEHAAAVAQLKEEHAAAVARLKEEHAAEVAKLQDEHAGAVARVKEEDVARVKDAADKEVQDAKKNIVLRLFPNLNVSLLKGDLAALPLLPERPKLKGDPDKTADPSVAP